MKSLIQLSGIAVLSAMLLIGCGKSAEQKKMEADLNEEIHKLHDNGMELMSDLESAQNDLRIKYAKYDSIANDLAVKSKDAVDNTTSKIKTSVDGMNDWMMSHKPYDENAKHEEAMEMLNSTKEAVSKVTDNMKETLKEVRAMTMNLDLAIRIKKAEKPVKGKKK